SPCYGVPVPILYGEDGIGLVQIHFVPGDAIASVHAVGAVVSPYVVREPEMIHRQQVAEIEDADAILFALGGVKNGILKCIQDLYDLPVDEIEMIGARRDVRNYWFLRFCRNRREK